MLDVLFQTSNQSYLSPQTTIIYLTMLSILIPTFNTDCLCLVTDLQKQCEELQAQYENTFDYEIIVGDDASTDEATVTRNEMIEFLPNCEFVRMETNVGRACLRNWLIDYSHFDYVLLLDADAEVTSDNFLWKYWTARQENAVIVGGLSTPLSATKGCELRLKYELAAEKLRTLPFRQKRPYEFFSTFCVMFHRPVFNQVQFDARITEYGYEDALMGVRLSELNIPVIHIDNPLLHTGINDNESFLCNSEAALRTLSMLGEPMTNKARVSQSYNKLVKWKLKPLFLCFYRIGKGAMRKNLLSHRPSLFIFNLYKLGYYASIRERTTPLAH